MELAELQMGLASREEPQSISPPICFRGVEENCWNSERHGGATCVDPGGWDDLTQEIVQMETQPAHAENQDLRRMRNARCGAQRLVLDPQDYAGHAQPGAGDQSE